MLTLPSHYLEILTGFSTGHECRQSEIQWVGCDPDWLFCCRSCSGLSCLSELMSPPPPASAPLLEEPTPSPDSWWDLRTHKVYHWYFTGQLYVQQTKEAYVENNSGMFNTRWTVMSVVTPFLLMAPPGPVNAAHKSVNCTSQSDDSRQIKLNEHILIPQKINSPPHILCIKLQRRPPR